MTRKQLVAEVLYRLGVIHAVATLRRWLGLGGPLFLMGHRVLPAQAAQASAVEHMALLSGHAITPDELARRLDFVRHWVMGSADPVRLSGPMPLPRKFFLTFDDGYRDNLDHARAVLDARGIRAVIFFIGALVRKPDASPWWDRFGADALAAGGDARRALASYGERCGIAKRACMGLVAADLESADQQRYLSADEVHRLPDTFYVANHTEWHANLERLSDCDLAAHIESGDTTIRQSPRYLPVMAYPFGYHNDAVLNWVRRDGRYRMVFATGNGVDGDPHRQRRINLNVRSFGLFAAQCAGLMH